MLLSLFWAISRFDWINFADLHVDFRQKAGGGAAAGGSVRLNIVTHLFSSRLIKRFRFWSKKHLVVCNRTNISRTIRRLMLWSLTFCKRTGTFCYLQCFQCFCPAALSRKHLKASYPYSRRRSVWGGRRRTSASSTTWSCPPSSPGSPCTSSRWGWRGSMCPRCGLTTRCGNAGRTPLSEWAGSGSWDGPRKQRQDSTETKQRSDE